MNVKRPDNELTLGTREFKVRKLNAKKQFHIFRRMAPIFAELLPHLSEIKKLDGASQEQQLIAIGTLAVPFLNGLSKLSDVDADTVLYGLLSAAEGQMPQGNWARVAADNNMLMMEDLDLIPTLISIAVKAFMYNLSGFLSAVPQASQLRG